MKISTYFKGHIFLLEKIQYQYDKKYQTKILIFFVLMGFILIPAIQYLYQFLNLEQSYLENLLISISLAVVFAILMKLLLNSDYRILRLHSWKIWPKVQKYYFVQVVIIASILFAILFNQHIEKLIQSYSGVANFIFYSALPGFIWGILQEFTYRGLLQNELVRRFGSVTGIVIANLVFTFGPLHFYYFNLGSNNPVEWTVFITIFSIGLLFGIIYHRSGNLWLPAIFHAIWVLNWQ